MDQQEQWEHMILAVEWDDMTQQWVALDPFGATHAVPSLHEALSPYGEQGWEGVSLVPSRYEWLEWRTGPSEAEGTSDAGEVRLKAVTRWSATEFRILLKRRKQEEPAPP
jgi:hypothetical protein